MGTARDHYPEYFAERLWDWVPMAIREADAAEGGHALESLLRAVGANAAVLKRSDDRLWDDMFVELADDWAVPYLAKIVATRLVSALNPRARRADVAKTIYYRRRKGTLAVLEQLCADIAGWDAKVVEEFRRLARNRHGLDGIALRGRVTGTPEGGTADLRSVRGALLAGDPFDEFHYHPEARRPTGKSGRRGINTLSFHLHRSTVIELHGVTPRFVNDLAGPVDGYTFDPSGRDTPLFSDQFLREDWAGWQSAREGELPREIDCRLYNEEIFVVGDAAIAWVRSTGLIPSAADRAVAANSLSSVAGFRFVGRESFKRVLAGLPKGGLLTGAAVLSEIRRLTLAADSGRAMLDGSVTIGTQGGTPIAREKMRAAWLNDWAKAAPAGVDVLFDPALGRFKFDRGSAQPADLRAHYSFSMSARIGAGAAGRRTGSKAPTVTWAQGSVGPGIPTVGVLELDDSATFANPPDQTAITDLQVRAREGRRPFVLISSDWRLGASGNNRELLIDGLWIGALAGRLRLLGSWSKVTLRYCTFDPGGLDAVGTTIPPCGIAIFGNVDELIVDRCILPGIAYAGTNPSVDRLTIRDSIVDASQPGSTGVAAPRTALTLQRSTVFGSSMASLVVDVEELDATDSLIAGIADVTNQQAGCFRFSARGDGSSVPHPYQSHHLFDLQRLFASRRFGDPHYAELSPIAPAALARGSEDDCEIGAWASERRPIRLDGLQTKIDEYMPFGRLPALIMEN